MWQQRQLLRFFQTLWNPGLVVARPFKSKYYYECRFFAILPHQIVSPWSPVLRVQTNLVLTQWIKDWARILMAHLSNKRIQLVTRWGNLIRITPLSGTNNENHLQLSCSQKEPKFIWNQQQTFIHKNWYVSFFEIKEEYARRTLLEFLLMIKNEQHFKCKLID